MQFQKYLKTLKKVIKYINEHLVLKNISDKYLVPNS